ncbi:MAG: hypothetical protein ABSF82_11770 [Candidatus Bathyarchaeia archaeon]|jgi:hypothetical protein
MKLRVAKLAIVAILFLAIQIPHAHSQGTLVLYPLVNLVILDGTYTTAKEWSDTIALPMEAGVSGIVGYFAAKYDSNYLYVVWDFVGCQAPYGGTDDRNEVGMYLDPSNQKSNSLNQNVYRLDFADVGGFLVNIYASEGTSSGGWTDWTTYTGTDIKAALSYSFSPNSKTTHMIVEARIALAFASLKTHVPGTIGLYLYMKDATHTDLAADYPGDANFKIPSTWGSLQTTSVPISEFPEVVPVLLLALLVVATFLRRTRKSSLSGAYSSRPHSV